MNETTNRMKRTATFFLTAVLLAPLTAVHAKRNSPGVPRLGILRAGFFQVLETFGAMASKAWN
jgi:predicted small integral membrane protein